MKEECKKANPNIDILKEKMKRTFAERVGFIQSHSTSDILQEFPALQHISIILTEIEHIFKVDVDKRLLEGFGKAADKIIAEAKRRRLGKEILLQYQTALSQECKETHKGHTVCAAILLLPYLFHENPDRLYVIDKVANAPTPVLLISGNPFSAGCEMSLRIDGMDIVKPEDISMGVGALLGIYFIFGVKYAENVKKTLNFCSACAGLCLLFARSISRLVLLSSGRGPLNDEEDRTYSQHLWDDGGIQMKLPRCLSGWTRWRDELTGPEEIWEVTYRKPSNNDVPLHGAGHSADTD
ncbi:hypothetical protein DPEC_G00227830 [Dallia pectoralis]|uniref:Uncharacterized protein n=1 Tax=Dallia pectoralis TaxID=75939 RepID=A0ACC2G0Q8_DALPE|nr:hypothetical protein DPEC_G00227830 [Dallia pectoralis]